MLFLAIVVGESRGSSADARYLIGDGRVVMVLLGEGPMDGCLRPFP